MKIVDTHCHLNDPSFLNRLDEVIERAKSAGVTDFIVPSYDEPSLKITSELSSRYKNIHPAFGIHPWYINEEFDLSLIESFISSNRTVAVGEIGLDFSPEIETPHKRQINYFVEQVELAIRYNLPVLIHCRKAHNDMLEILKRYSGRVKGIMHSFSGSKELLREFEALGLYFSFSGAVTRTHAKKYHKNAIAVSSDRILFETDAPSISTQSVEARYVEPCHIVEIVKFVSELRGVAYQDMADLSTRNVMRLFGERIGGE